MYLNQEGPLLSEYSATIRVTVYVYARSIRYAIDVFNSGQRKDNETFGDLLKFSRSSFATYGHLLDRASYGQSDQILQTAVKRRGFTSCDEQLKCVENSHFSTTDYCTVKLAPAAKLIQYYV